jgi:hypothetical protein
VPHDRPKDAIFAYKTGWASSPHPALNTATKPVWQFDNRFSRRDTSDHCMPRPEPKAHLRTIKSSRDLRVCVSADLLAFASVLLHLVFRQHDASISHLVTLHAEESRKPTPIMIQLCIQCASCSGSRSVSIAVKTKASFAHQGRGRNRPCVRVTSAHPRGTMQQIYDLAYSVT